MPSHPLIYPESEDGREYSSRKLLSHTVKQEARLQEIKQSSPTTQWIRTVSAFLPLRSLNLCIHSISLYCLFFPSPICIFGRPWRQRRRPEFPCKHHRQSCNIGSNARVDQRSSFKSGKSSLAPECQSEGGGRHTDACMRKTVYLPCVKEDICSPIPLQANSQQMWGWW